MMRKTLWLVSCLLLTITSIAADKYPVRDIPAGLLKNANAVKRMEEIELKVSDIDEYYLTKRYAITILNAEGERYAPMVEFYDKMIQIRSVEGRLFDAQGTLIRTLKSKEISDMSATDDNSLIDDNRRKVHQFYYKNYPYTVEYEIVIKSGNTLFYPSWVPQEGSFFSVEKSSYTVFSKPDYEVRYRAFNYNGQPFVAQEKNNKSIRFVVSNLAAIRTPFASPRWRELSTVVYFGPTAFKVEGYSGNMSSWKEFGKFQYSLNHNRDKLPPAIVQKVKEITNGILDDAEKVRTIYRYLQQSTRYISIQLGLGGWQPFEASFVAQKGYGDCKALTNYMYSMLKAAGISSNQVLIKAGEGEENYLIEDFPSNQFNHVVLCVPMAKDTLWLECTSQTAPPGYMGEFTGNRKGLLIDESGGSIVTTPRYTKTENKLERKITAKLGTTGSLAMKVSTEYGGLQQDDLSQMVNQLSKEKIKEILQEMLELSTYQVNAFHYEETREILPRLKEELDVTVNGYATVSGKRIFITPNILNRNGRKMEEDTSRKVDFVFGFEYHDADSYEIEIPEGYILETLPQDVSINSRFGSYHSSVTLKENKILYKRTMERYAGRFPASSGKELAKFYSDVYKADRSRMVLVKDKD